MIFSREGLVYTATLTEDEQLALDISNVNVARLLADLIAQHIRIATREIEDQFESKVKAIPQEKKFDILLQLSDALDSELKK